MANEDAFSALSDAVIDQLAETSAIRFRRHAAGGAFSATSGAVTGGSSVLSSGVAATRRGGEPDVILRGAGEGMVRTEMLEYVYKQADLAGAWALGEAAENDLVQDANDSIEGRIVEVRREAHGYLRRVLVQRLPNTAET